MHHALIKNKKNKQKQINTKGKGKINKQTNK